MDSEPEPGRKFEMFNLPFTLVNYGKRKSKERGKYARFNRRMLAATVDSLLLLVFLPVINALAPVHVEALGRYTIDSEDPDAARRFLLYALTNQEFVQSWVSNFMMQMLFWCVFSAICLHFWSATPGKMLLRMKVVDAKTEGPITDMQVFLRSFGYLVSTIFFCMGFFWIGMNKRHRGWHDYLADTVVINLPLAFWKKAPKSSETSATLETSPYETPPD